MLQGNTFERIVGRTGIEPGQASKICLADKFSEGASLQGWEFAAVKKTTWFKGTPWDWWIAWGVLESNQWPLACHPPVGGLNQLSYFRRMDLMKSLPLADFSCLSLVIASFFEPGTSWYNRIHGLYLAVHPLFRGLLWLFNLASMSEVYPIYILSYSAEYKT